MAVCLHALSRPIGWGLLRKGQRVFGLLGRATLSGLAPYGPEDLGRSWAVTAEFGCLRLEWLRGDEEVTGGLLALPTPASYNYGILGIASSPALVRAVFGLLPSELDQLVNGLRRGNFPVLGFSRGELRCSLSSGLIPAFWPHVVLSDLALYGNVVSLEAFARVLVSSLPQAQLSLRFPKLQPALRQALKLVTAHRRGLPYTREVLALAPVAELAAR